VAFQRASGYNVVIVDLWWYRVPRVAIKVPDAPSSLGLRSPYPNLVESWNASEHEWGWTIPSMDAVPDLAPAIELVAPFHPARGPMVGPP
jgi:hypothetical protein